MEIVENGVVFVVGDKVILNIGEDIVLYIVMFDDVVLMMIVDIVVVVLKFKIDELGIVGLIVDYDSGILGILDFINVGMIDLSVSG